MKEGQTYNSCIKDEIAQMNEHYVGEYPAHIPMMPEKVLREELEAKYDFEKIILEDHKLPVGLDFEDVELVSLDVTKPSILSAKVPKDLEILNDKIFVELEKLKTSATTILIDAEMNMSNKKIW